jgi:hypothetical protein
MSWRASLRSLLAVERHDVACGDRDAQRLRRHLDARRWEPVHDFLEGITDPDDRDFYTAAVVAQPGRPEWLERWLAAKPNSGITWLVRGMHAVQWAWEARGSGWSDTVTAQGWKDFRERLAMAEQELHRAAELAPADPTPWVALMWSAIGSQLGIDVIHQRFEQATRRHAFNRNAHTSWLQAQCAKWFGSHDKDIRFARKTVAQLPEGHTLHVLIAIAHVERHNMLFREKRGHESDGYFRQPDVREEINDAARRSVLLKPPPKHRHVVDDCNYFAYCFHRMGQKREARTMFRRAAPWVTMPWGIDDHGVEPFVAARKQCRTRVQRIAGATLPYLGVNLFGVAFLAAVIGSVAAAMPSAPNGAATLVAGLGVFGADVAFRRWVLAESLIDDNGPELLYLPIWVWGILWTVVGSVQLAVHFATA